MKGSFQDEKGLNAPFSQTTPSIAMSESLSQFWKAVVVTQICTGSVSFIASLVIVTFLAKNGLSDPYRRIVFGLSISDILKSVGMVAGPFLNRTDVPQALWAIGNPRSCQLTGFLFMVGATAVPMYTLSLCIYYVCKCKIKMTDDQFAHRVEKKIHAIVILLNVGLHLTAFVIGTIKSSAFGNMCLTAAFPTGCRQNPEIYGECDPGSEETAEVFTFIYNICIPVVCIVGIIVCLAMIFWNVVLSERICGHPSGHDSEAISRLYKRELVTQGFLYVSVFLLSSIPYMTTNLIYLSGSEPSRNLYRTSAILYPLGGLFNIFIYSRLSVENFHRRHPQCSRVQAFWLVLKAGGGIPSDAHWNESMAWNICCCCRDLSTATFRSVINRESNDPPRDNEEQHQSDHIEELRDHDEDSGEEPASLFPITHADVANQVSVSELRVMMQSRPHVSFSMPDYTQEMIEGSAVTSNDPGL